MISQQGSRQQSEPHYTSFHCIYVPSRWSQSRPSYKVALKTSQPSCGIEFTYWWLWCS